MTAPDQEERASINALLQMIVAMREGKLRTAGCFPDAKSQDEADRRAVPIPARFWRSMLDHEIGSIMLHQQGATLDAGQCIRLWECLKRKSTPPKELVVAFSSADVLRHWPGRRLRSIIAIRCPKCGKPRIWGEACRHCGAA